MWSDVTKAWFILVTVFLPPDVLQNEISPVSDVIQSPLWAIWDTNTGEYVIVKNVCLQKTEFLIDEIKLITAVDSGGICERFHLCHLFWDMMASD